MINKISKMLLVFFERKISIKNEEKEVLEYGLNALMHTVISTLLLLIIGGCMGRLEVTIVFVAVFYVNQTIGGGYHARTHRSCFAVMVFGLLIGLLLFRERYISINVYVVCALIGIIVLLLIPLVLNKNKEYLEYRAKQLASRSRLLTIIELLFLIVLYNTNMHAFKAFAIALVLSGISRVAGYIVKTRNRRQCCNSV